jgi:hypothetical protein
MTAFACSFLCILFVHTTARVRIHLLKKMYETPVASYRLEHSGQAESEGMVLVALLGPRAPRQHCAVNELVKLQTDIQSLVN